MEPVSAALAASLEAQSDVSINTPLKSKMKFPPSSLAKNIIQQQNNLKEPRKGRRRTDA